jgi:2-isopropylmalate synthase
VRLRKGEEILEEVSSGSGPIDAAYKAVEKITGIDTQMDNYNLRGVSRGMDALGEVSLKINYEDKNIIGRGISTDIVEASVKAYLDGVNKLIRIMNSYNQ